MTAALECPRSWQAEAAEDRRLSDADRASFDRHLATCAVCARVVRELAQLRNLAARTEAAASSPLEHRRARNELLRRANELTLEAPPRRSWRGVAVAAALVAACVAVAVTLRLRAPAAPGVTALSEPSYELHASTGAEWSFVERGSTLKLATRRGRFELSVRHLSPGQRFVLVLPDGELEVRGTRFVVEVDGARTLGVRVEEGRVALRVREREGSPLLLGAGERFAAAEPSPVSAASSAPAAEITPPPALAPRRAVADATPLPSAGDAVPALSSAQRVASADNPTGADFARAMSAFSSGNYGEAQKRFQAFAAVHPGDPRAEDATFLSAVASARRGDRDGARTLAQRYLARYPSGLRRREALELAK